MAPAAPLLEAKGLGYALAPPMSLPKRELCPGSVLDLAAHAIPRGNSHTRQRSWQRKKGVCGEVITVT